jgi:hypothetical protein
MFTTLPFASGIFGGDSLYTCIPVKVSPVGVGIEHTFINARGSPVEHNSGAVLMFLQISEDMA